MPLLSPSTVRSINISRGLGCAESLNYGARDLDGDRVVCHHFRIHLEFGSTICLPSFGEFQGFP